MELGLKQLWAKVYIICESIAGYEKQTFKRIKSQHKPIASGGSMTTDEGRKSNLGRRSERQARQ